MVPMVTNIYIYNTYSEKSRNLMQLLVDKGSRNCTDRTSDFRRK